jgi:hypothetical protein
LASPVSALQRPAFSGGAYSDRKTGIHFCGIRACRPFLRPNRIKIAQNPRIFPILLTG